MGQEGVHLLRGPAHEGGGVQDGLHVLGGQGEGRVVG